MDDPTDNSIPQWKQDLILRIRSKNKWFSDDQQQLLAGTPRNSSASVGCAGQQPSLTCSSAAVPVINSREGETWKCNEKSSTCTYSKMVKEPVLIEHKQFNNFESVNDILENGDNKSADSGSSEELHYGPGIVNKLKNRYLSLTLRENNAKTRPSILPMRKATSLEHLLDDDLPNGKPVHTNSRLFQSRYKENDTSRSISKRYYNATRGGDLKRARSVETISRSDDQQHEPLESDIRRKHESLYEDTLIVTEGSDKPSGKMYDNKTLEITLETKPFSNSVSHIINRPKRITAIMSEKEKPPVDVVKQAKKIFEGRADQRTKPPHQTGEVAAKVASYKNNVIGQSRVQPRNNKKPPIPKQKPVVPQDNNRRPVTSSENTKLAKPSKLALGNSENGWITEEKSPSPDIASIPRSSPIPDVSRISSFNREELCNNNQSKNGSNLSETPDLIVHSSPIKNASSPTFRILATDNFLKAEINHSNSNNFIIKLNFEADKKQHIAGVFKPKARSPSPDEQDGCKNISSESRNKIRQAGNTTTYNISTSPSSRSHLPLMNKEMLANSKTVGPQPGKTTHTNKSVDKTTTNSQISPSSKPPLPAQSILTPQEIEKNNINTAKTLEQVTVLSSPVVSVKSVEEVVVKKIEVPKTTLPREPKEQNSIVFKFTDRKEVPDYVGNDGRIRIGKIEKPKVGEGGIILLPGATLDESIADDDDDWMLSLEGPPSPCDVVFINDNVLIGRSSLSQKSKKSKMKLKFVESGPDIYEYPSEASMLDDLQIPSSRESSPGHIVPTLAGSSLANYIPKSGSTDDFQLGITRSMPTPPLITEAKNDGAYLESLLDEVDEPVLFSAGTNSDILF